MDSIHLVITTPDGSVVDEMVSYVNIPTAFGSLGVLKGHTPMLCAVAEGRVKCRFGDNETGIVKVGSGIANVADNEISILVSHAEIAE